MQIDVLIASLLSEAFPCCPLMEQRVQGNERILHTHRHTNTHTHTQTNDTRTHTHSQTHTHTHGARERWTHTHTHLEHGTVGHTHTWSTVKHATFEKKRRKTEEASVCVCIRSGEHTS